MPLKRYTFKVGDILKIESNWEGIRNIFDLEPIESSENENFKSFLKFELSKDIFAKNSYQKFSSYFFYSFDEKNSFLYYERPFLWTKLKFLIENLEKKETKILANLAYFKMIKFNLGTYYPISAMLRDVISLKLLMNGCTLAHAGCISKEGSAILFPAPADTGKTTTVYNCAANLPGVKYVSDDTTFIKGREVLASYPCLLQSPQYVKLLRLELSRGEALRMRIGMFVKAIPILSKMVSRMKFGMPYKSFDLRDIKNIQIGGKAEIKHICFLEIGNNEGLFPLSKEEAFKKLIFLNDIEYNYFYNPFFLAYSYLNKNFNLHEVRKQEIEAIKNLINNIDCYTVKAKDSFGFAEQIMPLLKDAINE